MKNSNFTCEAALLNIYMIADRKFRNDTKNYFLRRKAMWQKRQLLQLTKFLLRNNNVLLYFFYLFFRILSHF